MAAQREYEELKLPYYASITAAIAVTPEVSRAHAGYLVRLVQDLSMTQLVILSIAGSTDECARLRNNDYNGSSPTGEQRVILAEIIDLDHRSLLGIPRMLMGLSSVVPSELCLQGEGSRLFYFLGLNRMNQSRKDKIIAALS